MIAYLIFDLKHTLKLLNKSNFFYSKKKTIFITDKIVVFNILKKNKIQTICLDSEISNSKRKKIFIKNYNYFDKKLKEFGEKNYFIYKKKKLNSIYNTYKFNIPRHYVGIKFLLLALEKVVVKKKLKKIIYLNDLGNELLDNNFYTSVLELFCKKKKILFEKNRLNNPSEDSFIEKLLVHVINYIYIFKEFRIEKVLNITKKKLFRNIFFKHNFNQVIIGPFFDLNHVKNNSFKAFYYNIEKLALKLFKMHPQKNIELTGLKNIDDIFLTYLKKKNIHMKEYFIKIISITENLFRKKKIKKIIWGISPSPFIRNLIIYLKKYFIMSGIQHGGKYFIMEDDIYHKDSDFSFCDKYYSYGVNKSFNKKKFSPNTEIIDSGCLKTKYSEKKLSIVNEENILNNILFIPISLNVFTCPAIESSQTTRFSLQKEICESLNLKKKIKIFY